MVMEGYTIGCPKCGESWIDHPEREGILVCPEEDEWYGR